MDENENPAVPVQNLTLDSYCTLNDKELQLNFSWVPPTEVFETLTDYEVSLGPQVLTAREEATANGFFKSRIAVRFNPCICLPSICLTDWVHIMLKRRELQVLFPT